MLTVTKSEETRSKWRTDLFLEEGWGKKWRWGGEVVVIEIVFCLSCSRGDLYSGNLQATTRVLGPLALH